MANYINLNKHIINLNDGRSFEPSGTVCTVGADFSAFDENGICSQVFGEVQGLPAPQEGVIYIVNLIVLAALGGSRPDCVAPATGHPARIRFPKGDPREGQVKSVPGFVR